MVGKGQPKKNPEDKRKNLSTMFSPKEKGKIDAARERTGEKLGAFIRDASLKKANEINNRE